MIIIIRNNNTKFGPNKQKKINIIDKFLALDCTGRHWRRSIRKRGKWNRFVMNKRRYGAVTLLLNPLLCNEEAVDLKEPITEA